MAATQKQIAEKLGVSIALVSRVLSGKAEEIGIAPATIARVVKAAEAMGYVPSAAALSLKGKATRTLGVVVYDFKDPFFGIIIERLQMLAHEHNYSLILAGFLNRTPDEQDLQALNKHALDGLIVIGTDLNADWLNGFKTLPVARIGHGGTNEPSVRVGIDEIQCARLIAGHLSGRKCRRVTYLCADLPAHRIRQKAFEQAATERGMDLHTEQSSERDAFGAGRDTAGRCTQTDALICATDQVAIGALNTLQKIKTPPAVTGFDDIPAASQFIPPVTTIRQPINQMVQTAFDAVITEKPAGHVLLPGQLIARQSA